MIVHQDALSWQSAEQYSTPGSTAVRHVRHLGTRVAHLTRIDHSRRLSIGPA